MGTLPQQTEPDIQRIVGLVVETVRPLRVVLFGSRARGDSRPGSDIDLMILMPDGTNRLHVAKRLYRLGIPSTEFVVTTPTIYEARKDSFGLVYRNIHRDGRELYAAL